MSRFVLEIWDDECDKVTFYTVRYEDSDISETDAFYKKYKNHPKHNDALNDLTALIFDSIGQKHGAIDDFFRPEEHVEAIPPRGKVKIEEIELYYPEFPLRLYTLRIENRKDILILFNGGEKTARSNYNSSLSMQFRDANNFGKKIIEALNDGTIVVNNITGRLEMFQGDGEIYL